MSKQTSWGYCLDHIDLPYQFGILIMSTLAALHDFPQKLTEFTQYEQMRVQFFLHPPLLK